MFLFTYWEIVTDVFLLILSPIILGLIPNMILYALISSTDVGYEKLLNFKSKHPNLSFLIYYIIGILALWSMGKENFVTFYPNLYLFIYEYFLATITFPFQILTLS